MSGRVVGPINAAGAFNGIATIAGYTGNLSSAASNLDSTLTTVTTDNAYKLATIIANIVDDMEALKPLLEAEEDTESFTQLVGRGGYDVLKKSLTEDIENKDYGVDSDAEEKIFSRMRERELRVMSTAVDSATLPFTSGGFTAPTGASAAAIARVQAEARDKIISGNRDMTDKVAELYVSGKKNTIDAAVSLENVIITKYDKAREMANQRVMKLIDAHGEILKAKIQAVVAAKAAVMSALNLNVGTSVSASASISGSESISESHDMTAGTLRKSETKSSSVTEERNKLTSWTVTNNNYNHSD